MAAVSECCSVRSSWRRAPGASTCSGDGPSLARKLPSFQRQLDARALFSVAYGEGASSIYFALGVIVGHALRLTPLLLLGVRGLFLLLSLSYAEGTATLPA